MDAKKNLVTHNAIQDQISKIDNKIQKTKIVPLSNHTLPLSTSNTLEEMQIMMEALINIQVMKMACYIIKI
jgi:hypothetical protein